MQDYDGSVLDGCIERGLLPSNLVADLVHPGGTLTLPLTATCRMSSDGGIGAAF